MRAALVFSLVLLSWPMRAGADEGQWTPEQIAELDGEKLESAGLRISPSALWSENGGRLSAAVNYSGCSGGFISRDGLILTNHHCAYGALQSQSTPERDLLANGFIARARDEELPALSRNKLLVLEAIEDVTGLVRAAAAPDLDPGARQLKVDRKKKELARDCEAKQVGLRCQVEEFFLGSEYRLFRYRELRDLRLVYAPPASIGEYGGEIDNWMWPRHTGDFAILRAYVALDGASADYDPKNVPFVPPAFFPISAEGVNPGAFVMVVGYPGRTYRYLPASEVSRQLNQILPETISQFSEWLNILDAQAQRSRAVEIKVAALRKSLANRKKNADGMILGLQKLGLEARRVAEEAELAAWAEKAGESHAGVLAELTKLSESRRETFARDFLLEAAPRVSNLLGIAVDLVRRARERTKDDLDRVEAYRDRNQRDLVQANERRLRDFDPKVEQALLESILGHGDALLAEGANGAGPTRAARAATRAFVASILKDTTLHRREVVDSLFEADSATLAASSDPMLELAMRFTLEIEAKEAEEAARAGQMLSLGPLYVEMLKAVRRGPVYPDANGTLRFSYAKVSGYSPRDGLFATPQTTLGGALAKYTGLEPFVLPPSVLNAASSRSKSRWADPLLDDIPTCFLSDADTTGGNSGSPVLNARGELVGLNFDRVWENIAGDFAYSPDRSRNVSVDVRFLLYLLEDIEKAEGLVAELGLSKTETVPEVSPEPPAKPTPTADCACAGTSFGSNEGALLAAFAFVLFGFFGRGRRRLRRR